MKTITIWSDFACPFCYIGEKRLKDAVKELGVENEIKFEYRAFELDPNAPIHPTAGSTADRLAAKYGISHEEAKKRIDAIERMGNDLGLDFRFHSVKSVNTFDAHRLMKFAESEYEPVVADALNFALFDAYFTKNLSLADRKVLLKLAGDAGIDEEQAKEVLEHGLYADQVRFDEKEAASRGVHGVPYMIFDGEFAVPGAISTEDCKTALRDILAKKEKKPEGFDAKACDESGCKV